MDVLTETVSLRTQIDNPSEQSKYSRAGAHRLSVKRLNFLYFFFKKPTRGLIPNFREMCIIYFSAVFKNANSPTVVWFQPNLIFAKVLL